MMKKLLIPIILLLATSSGFAISWYSFGEESDTSGGSSAGGEYNYVSNEADASGCYVVCFGGGPNVCDLLTNPCNFDTEFLDANSQEMFDHAHSEMDNNVLTGVYTDNIIPITGIKYYRTITWAQDSTGKRVLDYTLGID